VFSHRNDTKYKDDSDKLSSEAAFTPLEIAVLDGISKLTCIFCLKTFTALTA
jgi:hypothetical protein